MYQRPDPVALIAAFRMLVNASSDMYGPSTADAIWIAQETGAPEFWICSVVDGWRRFAEKYNRAFASEIEQTGPIRVLRANILPPLQFEDGDRPCRICGFQCISPARSWHPECFAQFEPQSAGGWKRITKEAMKRCGQQCEKCGADFKMLKKATLTPWRKVYDFDHIVPLFKGGTHGLENLQVLCETCHKEKTKRDLQEEDDE